MNKYYQENDTMFLNFFNKTSNHSLRDFKKENVLLRGTSQFCLVKEKDTKQDNKTDFLMTPCKVNSFQNYLVQDNNKICSKRHQFFNNLTKRI